MTYLQLVNAVLRRLRESEVSTITGATQNTYPKLIGDFINEAKQTVENAWDWSALRSTVTVTTSAGVYDYTLTGSGERFTIDSVIDETNKLRVEWEPNEFFEDALVLSGTATQGKPVNFTMYGSNNGDAKIKLYPVPDDVYSIKFNLVKRQADLSADSDVLLVPSRPVVLLAWAMAIEERGEDAGQQSINAYSMAQSALSDAIAFDAQRYPNELIWYTP